MPLVRVEVRNEYGLGVPEMYRQASKEEPKEILDGVAVAGLVGILRQLGDLSNFAAEVFHGLQEEVIITSSRSHKLMGRVQRIEAALSPLEKVVLAQRSHLHFAYTAGSNWCAGDQCDEIHFVYGDLPEFILDSYEDCRGPPNLHLLDRFDPGGPGSCLMRYSDPTFFKRASVASGEASIEKVSKDTKEHKIKNRRAWGRNGEVSRGASFSYQSGSYQLTRTNEDGHTSPSQSMSLCDATLRSELSEQSNIDSRYGSGHSEGDSRLSYSMQPKEQESRGFISAPAKRHDNNYQDYTFLNKEVRDACDYFQINLTGCSSSSVNWGEQNAVLEPKLWDCDQDGLRHEGDNHRSLESFSPKLDPESSGGNAVKFETVDKIDVQTCHQTLPALPSGDSHLDDSESEKYHFMDALNNIEPESETDIDCTRRQEVDHYFKLADKATEDGLHEVINHNLESQASNSESSVLVNSSPINGGFGHNPISVSSSHSVAFCAISSVSAKDECNSVAPANNTLQSAQAAGDVLNPGNPQSNSSPRNGDIKESKNVEFVPHKVSSNFRDGRPEVPVVGDTRSSPESQKPVPETSTVASVTFWTNGGLLGLQPSKPPDFSVFNDFPEDHLFKKDGKIILSSQNLNFSDKDPGKPDNTTSLKNIGEDQDTDSSTCQEYQESAISFRKTSWKISPADLDVKLGKTGDLLYPKNASSTRASITAPGSSQPVNTEFQAARKHPENTRNSFRMFELSNGLLTTGSGKKLVHGVYENSRHAGYQNSNASEKKNHQNFAYHRLSGQTKDVFGGESQILSPSSSPPLAPMKISFQPIDGFETSKLKLKFPDGHTNDERGRDIFPSFQLVPEVLITQHNVGSDSDADTFHRSSPSLSDDCHSHQSESNSEQWETRESLSGKDPELYDSLCRITLTESVSTVLENRRASLGDIHENSGLHCPLVENGMQNSQSLHINLQSLDSLNHSSQELSKDANSKVLVEPKFASTTDPSSLPPAQWDTKPHLDGIEDRFEMMPKGSSYAFDLKHLDRKISQQPKPAPINHDQILETPNKQKSKQSASQKSNRLGDANQGKSADENDFLQQIRAKSLSLRRTVPAKPTMPSWGSSNVQVTAILEKANAIRQAVGSDDDEDDDEWSDT
ncbi:hypothetical protein CDL12_07745 [Handroanthus impetiginosus]|uniref:Protein SCAR n=1 Tax=Handroanthus impetiginosus TaxID=429701 RepID=A0A2G9HPY0_9LAMI|nr:hypothetical protein CDL12_07745 [Handroanthus impetiginosus]